MKGYLTEMEENTFEGLFTPNKNVSLVFKEVSKFAQLPTGEYQGLRQRLKEHYGNSLNLKVLDKEVATQKKIPHFDSSLPTGEHVPCIVLTGKQLSTLVTKAIEALDKANNPPHFYTKGGTLCRVSWEHGEQPTIQHLTQAMMLDRLSQVATWVKMTQNRVVDAFPSKEIADIILSRGVNTPMPVLRSIVETPFLREDGTVVETKGYDPTSKVLYLPSTTFLPVPSCPTKEEIQRAKAIIETPIEEYPFKDNASKSNWLSFLFSTVIRPSISGIVPMYAIIAPGLGSGKTTLANIPSLIATGRKGDEWGETENEDEWRKRLTTCLLSPNSVALFDNLKQPLVSSMLEQVLTSTNPMDRLLGTNTPTKVENRKVWVATGNNLRVGDDLRRRTVPIYLDASEEQTFYRDGWKIKNVEKWVVDHRVDLVWSILTLARAWYSSNCPDYSPQTLGSYTSWATTIGNILYHVGYTDFLSNHRSFFEGASVVETQWAAFFNQWYAVYGNKAILVSKLTSDLKTAKSKELKELVECLPHYLADKLDNSQVGKGGQFQRALGEALSKRRDTVKGNLKLVNVGIKHSAVQWAMVRVENRRVVDIPILLEETSNEVKKNGHSKKDETVSLSDLPVVDVITSDLTGF